LVKTSGTTSGSKIRPVNKGVHAAPYLEAARNAILLYIHKTGNADFYYRKDDIFTRKPSFRRGNTGYSLDVFPVLVAHPLCLGICKKQNAFIKNELYQMIGNQIDAIVEETYNENMTVGFPREFPGTNVF
jgi:hypothetical protein